MTTKIPNEMLDDYVAGKFPRPAFENASGTNLTSNAITTIAHGLGANPYILQVYLECTSADQNWDVGDVFELSHHDYTTVGNPGGGQTYGASVGYDDTNVYVKVYANGFTGFNRTSNGIVFLDLTKWDIRVRAWT